MSLDLILTAIVLAAASGVPGLCVPRRSVWGQRCAVIMMVCSSFLGLAGAWAGLAGDSGVTTRIPWPPTGNSVVGVDVLSAFFLVPVFLMGGLGSIYGLGYWSQRRHSGSARKLQFFWGLLVAGPALLVISKHAMSFLFGWEVMALSAFFLVATEDHRDECRKAGWLYLIAAHVGTLTLFALIVLWRRATGSYMLQTVAHNALSLGAMNVLFFLALLGFGLKAGMMPLHFWLPGAHANAPSHVSAVLSGVVLKMGIYGLVRWVSLIPDLPAIWGVLILTLGAVSALLGVVFALGQHDLKRLLAYHSVENIGIILMGLGLAMLGRSTGRPEWVVLGLAGCLLHVWNHAFFKSLLFLCAGSVVHRVHTREMDRLGGLAKIMPWTATMFLVGAVAICGLPPLNGFVSEWLVYLGLLRAGTTPGVAGTTGAVVLGAPVLAMAGALALACFVKVYGAVFLGNARTQGAADAHESPASMRGPMLVLAVCCAAIGLAPMLVCHSLDRVIAMWSPDMNLTAMPLCSVASLGVVSVLALSLLAGMGLVTLLLSRRGWVLPAVGTWDCGYARPTLRMQYTASSFAQMIVALFSWVLRPRMHRPHLAGLFPQQADMESHVDDAVLDGFLIPTGHRIERGFAWFHRFQQGLTQHYVLYILITVILMLTTLIPIRELVTQWIMH